MIKVNLEFTKLNINELKQKYQPEVSAIHNKLNNNWDKKDDFYGWLKMPLEYDNNEFFKKTWAEMKITAEKLQKTKINILVVVGIGGSYLGARAGIEMIQGLFSKTMPIKVIYLGNTMSSTYVYQVLETLKDQEFAVNVISKSGTTTEPAIAFRLLKELLIKQKKSLKERIIATTDEVKGVLHDLAKTEGYQTFVIPNNIGGRYSVLTPVGIFPMMVAGIDCEQLIKGAQRACQEFKDNADIVTNNAYLYAVSRYHLHKSETKAIEILVSYEMQMQMFCEWWKQLFGESEGKDKKGLFPASVIFSTDLHSMGQFIQDGSKVFFETVIKILNPPFDVKIPIITEDIDQLNYLANKSLHQINTIALDGTLKAHSSKEFGNTPNIVLEWQKMDAEMFGYASYFFMKACAVSASLLKVNPFNQPGVEIYKTEMFKLLDKK